RLDEVLREVGQGEHALVDHDEAGALVAVPGEKGLRDAELGERVGPDPAAVEWDGLADPADHFLRVVGVFREGIAGDLHRRTALAGLHFADELLVTGATEQSEVARPTGDDMDLFTAVTQVFHADDRPGTG